MKKPALIIFLVLLQTCHIVANSNATPVRSEGILKVENTMGKNKKNKKGYKSPKSKKFLGIFKRKTDCGCPSH